MIIVFMFFSFESKLFIFPIPKEKISKPFINSVHGVHFFYKLYRLCYIMVNNFPKIGERLAFDVYLTDFLRMHRYEEKRH